MRGDAMGRATGNRAGGMEREGSSMWRLRDKYPNLKDEVTINRIVALGIAQVRGGRGR